MDFGVAFYVERPIKTASEISRINFYFVTLFYYVYNICIAFTSSPQDTIYVCGILL